MIRIRKADQYWYYLSSKGEAFNDEAKDAKAQNAEGVTATTCTPEIFTTT